MAIANLINAAPRTLPLPFQPTALPAGGDGRAPSFANLLTQARQPTPVAPPAAAPTPAAPTPGTPHATDEAQQPGQANDANRSDRGLERKAAARAPARPLPLRTPAKVAAEPAKDDPAPLADTPREQVPDPAAAGTAQPATLPPQWRPPTPAETPPAAIAAALPAPAAVATAAVAVAATADSADVLETVSTTPGSERPTTAPAGHRTDSRSDARARVTGTDRSTLDVRAVGGDRPAPGWLDAQAAADAAMAPAVPAGMAPAAGDGAAALAAAGAAATATATGTAPSAAAAEPAPPLQASVATPVTSPEFRAALGVQISVLASGGVQHAELQLNPAEMGPISVRIAMDGDATRVDFGADVARTRELIEAGWAELASALQDAGLTLSGGGVSQQSAGRQQAGGGGADRSRRDDGIGRLDDPKPTLMSRRPVSAGGIDTFA